MARWQTSRNVKSSGVEVLAWNEWNEALCKDHRWIMFWDIVVYLLESGTLLAYYSRDLSANGQHNEVPDEMEPIGCSKESIRSATSEV